MIYFIVAAVAITSIIFYYYYKPEKKVTKNVFNAEYYRGLNYLLNNKEDRAFKIFTALMDVDSSTIETHLALGGLYRKRGEFDKAILIHQNLLSRPTLEKELKNQALYELAKDFHSAGLYDRSEKIFKNLSEFDSYALSCYEELVKLYEVIKDWDKAINTINKSDSVEINNHPRDLLISHYLCEISNNHYNDSEIERAENEIIKDIFQNKGEEYFRKIEEKITLDILEKNQSVISIGGGAFLNNKIRKKIKKNSHSFWLNWKIKTILRRITKNKRRPLALKLNSKEMVNLYRRRVKFYKLSDFKVNCENKNKNKIISQISGIIKNENFIN